jgi:hypothetical protein
MKRYRRLLFFFCFTHVSQMEEGENDDKEKQSWFFFSFFLSSCDIPQNKTNFNKMKTGEKHTGEEEYSSFELYRCQ